MTNEKDSPVDRFETAVDAIITGNLPVLGSILQEDPLLIRGRSLRAHYATLLHYVSANGVEQHRWPGAVNGSRCVDHGFGFSCARVLPADQLIERACADKITGRRVDDLAVEKMDFAGAVVLGPKVQDGRREVQALKRNEVAST